MGVLNREVLLYYYYNAISIMGIIYTASTFTNNELEKK